jgi:hypothetical protein
VKTVYYFLRRNALFPGTEHNGNAVFIRTADVDNITTFETAIPGVDICG